MSTDLHDAISAAGLKPTDVVPLVDGDDSVFVASCPGDSALEVWSDIRSGSGRHGFWPVLFGSKESCDAHRELAVSRDGDDPPIAISKAASIDVSKYFIERLAEMREYGELPRAEWPASPETSNELSIHKEISSMQPLKRVFIGLLDTRESWATPALLRFGGWNDCPFPEQHAAVFRYWGEQYGAEIVGVSHDTIECLVSQPPMTRHDAVELAIQHYAHASDIVDQGIETIDALAGALLNGHAWYFWWD